MLTKLKSLKNHQGFMNYFKNTSWLFAEKILRMVVGLFVGIWVARYLGPEQFGMLSYVGAFVGLFAPLGKLGFDGIVSRDIAKDESDLDELISTTILFKFIGSLLIVLLVSSYMYFTKEQDIYFYLAIVLSFVFVVKSYEIMEFYFRAKVKAKYISIANSIAIVLSSLLKVIFILSKFSLIYFALANLVEAMIAIFLLYIYFKKEPNSISFVKINFTRGIELIKESWPLIFSGFFALIYLNIDQVMIQEMLGSYNVGQYSAAVRISSVWYFIPLTISWSVQTAIVNAKKNSEKQYYERLQMMFTLMVLMAYTLIIPISYFSDEIIDLLFGEAYAMAGGVLALHIVASLFVFVGNPRGLWVTNESYFKFDFLSNVGAGFLNVILNLIWIPKYGIIGAAWATLISYGFTYVLSGFFFSPARKVAWMQIKSVLLLDSYNQYKKFKEKF
jgi:O-antigen/teichoic acid export membrane protein